MSDRDIEAGQRWNEEISSRLKETDFGIICLTPENLDAPWLLFEAGALAKSLDNARVVPILLGFKKSDLTLPLAQFQSVDANREGFFSLASSVNKALAAKQLSATALNAAFDALWPSLEMDLEGIQKPPRDSTREIHRSDREVLEDVLEGVRAIQRVVRPSASVSTDLESDDWEDSYIRGVNFANKRSGPATDLEALRAYSQAIALVPSSIPRNALSRLYAYRAAMLKRGGRFEEAKNDLELAKQLAEEPREISDALYNMACVLAMLGEEDRAIAELSKLSEHNPDWLPNILKKRYFDSLADHPAFKALTKE